MARDLRNINANRNNYPDRCYYYGKEYVNHNKLVEDAKPLGRFYKTDVDPFKWTKIDLGNGTLSNDNHFIGTIETCDHVENLRVGMFVVDQTGMLFIVESPIVCNDANKSKVVGRRPSVVTTITLRGVETR